MNTRLLFVTTLLCLTPPVFGEPWIRHTIDNSSRGADGVRTADVNRDGHIDLVTGWEEGGIVRLYRNPGPDESKEPWPAVTVGQVASPEDAVFADLDGDGAIDVVSSCEGGARTMFFHWAPTDPAGYLDPSLWQTVAVPCTRRKQSWMFALPLQVDGSHGVDVVVASKGSGATIGWLQAPADAREVDSWQFHPLIPAGWIMSLQSHDMDADGDADILASDRNGRNRGILWLENPGPKTAAAGKAWKMHRLDAGDREVMFLARGDVDGDGRMDVVCTVRGRGISLLSQTGTASDDWQFHEIAMPAGFGTGKGIAVGDVNLDGKNDIVFSCENAGGQRSGVGWLEYHDSATESTWQHHNISGPLGTKFDRIELLDLDRDGDPDVVTCEERENLGVIWYENPSR